MLESLKVPVAVYCCVAPLRIEVLAGVTANDTSTGGVTVSPVEPLTVPSVAVMVVPPVAAPFATPLLLIAATAVVLELHVTELLTSWLVPSLNVPVAVYCCVVPFAIDTFAGVTAMELNVAPV